MRMRMRTVMCLYVTIGHNGTIQATIQRLCNNMLAMQLRGTRLAHHSRRDGQRMPWSDRSPLQPFQTHLPRTFPRLSTSERIFRDHCTTKSMTRILGFCSSSSSSSHCHHLLEEIVSIGTHMSLQQRYINNLHPAPPWPRPNRYYQRHLTKCTIDDHRSHCCGHVIQPQRSTHHWRDPFKTRTSLYALMSRWLL